MKTLNGRWLLITDKRNELLCAQVKFCHYRKRVEAENYDEWPIFISKY